MKNREPFYTLLSANQHCVRCPTTLHHPEHYYVKLELISSASFSSTQIIVQFVLETPWQADTWFTDILIELHRLISSYRVSFHLICQNDLIMYSILIHSTVGAVWLSGQGVGLRPVNPPCPAPDLWLRGDRFVRKLTAVNQPTRPSQTSIPSWPVNM